MRRNGTSPKNRHRAVGYVRRSTERQEQSIADQKRALESYVAEQGLQLVKFYIDDAISGTSTIGRRAFQQMMRDAQKPQRSFGEDAFFRIDGLVLFFGDGLLLALGGTADITLRAGYSRRSASHGHV